MAFIEKLCKRFKIRFVLLKAEEKEDKRQFTLSLELLSSLLEVCGFEVLRKFLELSFFGGLIMMTINLLLPSGLQVCAPSVGGVGFRPCSTSF